MHTIYVGLSAHTVSVMCGQGRKHFVGWVLSPLKARGRSGWGVRVSLGVASYTSGAFLVL